MATPKHGFKIGLVVPHWTTGLDNIAVPWSQTLDVARAAEAVGFDSLCTVDAPFTRGEQYGALVPLDCFPVLGALAGVPSRVGLGSIVTSVTFRAPAILASTANALDIIRGGRSILGIGAGSNTMQHTALGLKEAGRFG